MNGPVAKTEQNYVHVVIELPMEVSIPKIRFKEYGCCWLASVQLWSFRVKTTLWQATWFFSFNVRENSGRGKYHCLNHSESSQEFTLHCVYTYEFQRFINSLVSTLWYINKSLSFESAETVKCLIPFQALVMEWNMFIHPSKKGSKKQELSKFFLTKVGDSIILATLFFYY